MFSEEDFSLYLTPSGQASTSATESAINANERGDEDDDTQESSEEAITFQYKYYFQNSSINIISFHILLYIVLNLTKLNLTFLVT